MDVEETGGLEHGEEVRELGARDGGECVGGLEEVGVEGEEDVDVDAGACIAYDVGAG